MEQRSGVGRGARTLDLEHSSCLGNLRRNRQQALELRAELEAAEDCLFRLEANRDDLRDAHFESVKMQTDVVVKLRGMLRDMEHSGDEVDYYLRTGPLLFKYYDHLEKGRSVPPTLQPAGSNPPAEPLPPSEESDDAQEEAQEAGCPLLPAATRRPNSILHYFAGGGKKAEAPAGSPQPSEARGASATVDQAPQAAQAASAYDRATLLDRYLSCVGAVGPTRHLMDGGVLACAPGGVPGGSDKVEPCPHCRSTHSRTLILHDGYVFCPTCHTIEYVLVDHDKPSYKDAPKETAYFAYKRINHFNEWLNQVQGKETTEIPDEVYDKILLEIKKQKITNMALLTRKRVKDILKKLRINKYYEHAPHIINRLNGIPSPHLPQALEERLRYMFCMIQVPFLKHAPPVRKNFLSYSFCLNKMMQLLEKDQYLENFPLLKSREKLHQQDRIWEKICDELGWDFIPSL